MIKQRKITYKWSQLAPARDTGSGSKAVVLKLLSAWLTKAYSRACRSILPIMDVNLLPNFSYMFNLILLPVINVIIWRMSMQRLARRILHDPGCIIGTGACCCYALRGFIQFLYEHCGAARQIGHTPLLPCRRRFGSGCCYSEYCASLVSSGQ